MLFVSYIFLIRSVHCSSAFRLSFLNFRINFEKKNRINLKVKVINYHFSGSARIAFICCLVCLVLFSITMCTPFPDTKSNFNLQDRRPAYERQTKHNLVESINYKLWKSMSSGLLTPPSSWPHFPGSGLQDDRNLLWNSCEFEFPRNLISTSGRLQRQWDEKLWLPIRSHKVPSDSVASFRYSKLKRC